MPNKTLICLVKNFKSTLTFLLWKWPKRNFGKSLKMKLFLKSSFLTLKALFPNAILNVLVDSYGTKTFSEREWDEEVNSALVVEEHFIVGCVGVGIPSETETNLWPRLCLPSEADPPGLKMGQWWIDCQNRLCLHIILSRSFWQLDWYQHYPHRE